MQKAREENKLIFLSVGYSSCHWCHVMERESFEDENIAAYLNRHFVSIKVDREERPDIDAVYMEAVQMMTGQGGWPLSVWLTPDDQVPVFGGTYFPPRPSHGRPSFMQVLERLHTVYHTERDRVAGQVAQIRKAMHQDILSRTQPENPSDGHFKKAAGFFKEQFDEVDGGFSPAPKFPMAMGISYLLKHSFFFDDRSMAEMAAFSLESMMRGGIYDHLGGGWHRYSVDARWHVPHFEKMLYDNALLINALTDAWALSRDDGYRHFVEGTIGFLMREMRHPSGGFYSALDADSEGVEGKFYVWDKKEIERILPAGDAELFCSVYQVSSAGNWDGTNVLHMTDSLERNALLLNMKPEELRAKLKILSETLFRVREKRVRPGLDDKVITSWNAMLLKSLCKASRAFGLPDWKDAAMKLAWFLVEELIEEGKVKRFWMNGKTRQDGFLDDVALLSEALTYVFEVSGEAAFLHAADRLCTTLLDDYYDVANQGFHYSSHGHETLVARNRDLFDNATPSGNSAAIAALWRTGMLTGNTRYVDVAREAASRLVKTASDHATSFGYLLDAILCMEKHRDEVVISGENPAPFLEHFGREIPFGRLMVQATDASIIPYGTFSGKAPVKGKTACYFCRDFTCKAPVTNPDGLG